MSAYTEGIICVLCINAIAAMGVSLITGYTGIFSLGHAGYMAVGAYTAAILTARYGVYFVPAIVAGGLLAALVAYIIGIPTLKLVGDYYAIASIGLGEAIRLILENGGTFTRGARGFPGIPNYTNLTVAVCSFVIMAFLMFNLINGRFGRAFKACRDDYIAASLLGYDTAKYRILSLVISGFYCGVAGALLGGFLLYIKPLMFDMMKSTELTSVVVFGGLGSMSGTLLGMVIITLITEVFRPISQYRMLIYGAILVIIMVLRPEGIMGQYEFGLGMFRAIKRKPKGDHFSKEGGEQ